MKYKLVLGSLAFASALLILTQNFFVSGQDHVIISLITKGYDGSQSNENSNPANAMSADGRYIGFEYSASNLVSNKTNNITDVFVYDRYTSQNVRISVASDGSEGNGSSGHGRDCELSISANGRYAAFVSDSSNLVPDDTNGKLDVFVHDLSTSNTSRVSVDSDGNEGSGESFETSISANGRYIAFATRSRLDSDDITEGIYVYVHDQTTVH